MIGAPARNIIVYRGEASQRRQAHFQYHGPLMPGVCSSTSALNAAPIQRESDAALGRLMPASLGQ